jgi:hypothetical protein
MHPIGGKFDILMSDFLNSLLLASQECQYAQQYAEHLELFW